MSLFGNVLLISIAKEVVNGVVSQQRRQRRSGVSVQYPSRRFQRIVRRGKTIMGVVPFACCQVLEEDRSLWDGVLPW